AGFWAGAPAAIRARLGTTRSMPSRCSRRGACSRTHAPPRTILRVRVITITCSIITVHVRSPLTWGDVDRSCQHLFGSLLISTPTLVRIRLCELCDRAVYANGFW
uniref:Uncharacterized protein n=1 Tax=Aegilops tauschii subsp. strangulata TaxID=200361 RepID=A0A453GPF7_AEGTS